MRLLTLLAAALLLTTVALAADQGTPDEAKAMAVKAAAYLQSAGPEKAFAAFDATQGAWQDRDLYVIVFDLKGVAVARGNNPGLIGKSLIDLKDVDGRAFIQEIVAISDTGWVSYKWQNPISKAVETKTSYVVRAGDYVIAVGAYTK
jgi:cytochrome c